MQMDAVTLDQLRTLVAVVESGSFSAAGRKLQRVQSAVSTQVANLEASLGLVLFDRSSKVPTLTDGGRGVLVAARRVLSELGALSQVAGELAGGVEAQVSLCIDALFPLDALVEMCTRFAKQFPDVDLRVDSQTLGAVAARVLDGSATLGVTVPVALQPGFVRHALGTIRMVPVVAKTHALAKRRRPSADQLERCVQIVLSERQSVTPDQAVESARTWRVADLATKRALIVAGLGWGNLPTHLIENDLHHRRLVEMQIDAWGKDEHTLHLTAIHLRDRALGPAHRWVLEQLGVLCAS